MAQPRFPKAIVWVLLGVLVSVIGAGLIGILIVDEPSGDPGRLTEALYAVDVPPVGFTIVTSEWGLDNWSDTSGVNFGGAVAIGDLNGDGRNDLVAGGGTLVVFLASDDGFEAMSGVPASSPDAEVVSLGMGDVDRDGLVDLLVGRRTVSDLVIWGGEWTSGRDIGAAEVTDLPSDALTTGFSVADFNGDHVRDVLAVSHSTDDGVPARDAVFVHDDGRGFTRTTLPDSDRLSFALEVADVDDDGLVDLWVTRDVGWISGGDSVYSRNGESAGEWDDIAADIGGDLEIDGMGVTRADLTGDGRLDVYITDIGENEFLAATSDGFEARQDHGAARIGPGQTSQVSVSWGAGVADFNLDGLADLVVANGGFEGITNKVPNTDVAIEDAPAVFLGLGDGRYGDGWGGAWAGSTRGLAIGDLDGDGDSDIAMVVHGGGLVVLRNNIGGPSLTVRPERQGCFPDGSEIRVGVGQSSIMQMLTAHTFLGVHATEAIVGHSGIGVAVVKVSVPGLAPITSEIELRDARQLQVLPCPD